MFTFSNGEKGLTVYTIEETFIQVSYRLHLYDSALEITSDHIPGSLLFPLVKLSKPFPSTAIASYIPASVMFLGFKFVDEGIKTL